MGQIINLVMFVTDYLADGTAGIEGRHIVLYRLYAEASGMDKLRGVGVIEYPGKGGAERIDVKTSVAELTDSGRGFSSLILLSDLLLTGGG